MNTIAVLLGLFYGILSIVACYLVAMITSGLFSRPFYRLYARLLIAICAVMLAAPGLRWLATVSPQWAVIGLTAVHYVTLAVLAYGVFRFNRDYMKRVFMDRSSTAYFVFGTLANATIVTLGFLHVAVSGTPGWGESATGYLVAANYGPPLVVLSAMIFHTDYRLKSSVGDLRRFSRFTFLGYAVSFLGLGLSVMPYFAKMLGQLNLVAIDSPLLHHFFAAQALLIAIGVYAWMVWRYESVPPLFLLLFAIIGEYHVLVTQWVIGEFGPASWGLASLPLFAGLVALAHYFAKWDDRRRASSDDGDSDLATLRVSMPFRLVGIGMAIALLGVTLWTRFAEAVPVSPSWLAATFGVYSLFFLVVSVKYRRANLLYASGLLTALAGFLGVGVVGGDLATAAAGLLAVGWSSAAWFGTRIRLKSEWRTPLADNGLIIAVVSVAMVVSRHLIGDRPYLFQLVALADGISLLGASSALLLSALAYRSRVPVFAALFALALAIPPWNAALGLAATGIAALIQRKWKTPNRHALDDRVRLFGKWELPSADVFPSLFVQPLKLGAIPLSLIGLTTSAVHVFQGQLTTTVLLGAAISALALLLLSLSYRDSRLYVTALLATYFAIHVSVQGTQMQGIPIDSVWTAHLVVAAFISISGWIVADLYARWCGALLKRVHETQEAEIEERRSFYSGLLFYVTTSISVITLILTLTAFVARSGSDSSLFVAMILTSAFMACAASLYRSQVWVYLSLVSGSMALVSAITAFGLPYWEGAPAIVAVIAATFACFADRWTGLPNQSPSEISETWIRPTPLLNAQGIGLWVHPTVVLAILSGLVAAASTFPVGDLPTLGLRPSVSAALACALAGVAFLLCTRVIRSPLLYGTGIVSGFASAHWVFPLLPIVRTLGSSSLLLHLTLSAVLALAACVTATILAVGFSRIGRDRDQASVATIEKERSFYAGILMHSAFVVSLLTLVGLFGATIHGGIGSSGDLLTATGLSLLLAVTFAAMSVVYRSRIQSYCTLTAACFAFYWTATMFAPEFLQGDFQAVALTFAAVAWGVVAWSMTRSETEELPQRSVNPRIYDCWSKPPLPMVSNDSSLWSLPLTHFSVLSTVAGLALVIRGWVMVDQVDPVIGLKVLPLYLAAIASWIATRTNQFSRTSGTDADVSTTRQQLITGCHVCFYISSLLILGIANHMTFHLLALHEMSFPQAGSWHLLLAALSVLTGWTAATIYTYVRTRQSEHDTEAQAAWRRKHLMLYGGVLHHSVLAAAIGTLACCCLFGTSPSFNVAPLLGCLGCLILYFWLASFTYRFRLPSYLATITMGLAAVHVVGITEFGTSGIALSKPHSYLSFAIGLLGLSMACLAFCTKRSGDDESTEVFLPVPTPWPTRRVKGKSLWFEPLCQSSLAYATIALLLMMVSWPVGFRLEIGATQALVVCLFSATTFYLLAWLYRSPVISYAGVLVTAGAVFPVVVLLDHATLPVLGIGLAFVALAFWICAFVAGRIAGRRFQPDQDAKPSAVIRIYEKPFVRCSAMLAAIALSISLGAWWLDGRFVSKTPIVFASALGAITLLLNARSLSVVERAAWARGMVYLACVSLTCCWLAAYSILWDSFHGLGPAVAVTALAMAVIGMVIIGNARSITEARPASREARLAFGEPISNFASALLVLAIALTSAALIRSGVSIQGGGAGGLFMNSQSLLPLGVTLMISVPACLMFVRVQKRMAWLYAAVVFATSGLWCVLESLTQWSVGVSVVVAMVMMNACVLMGQFIRNNDRVERVLRLEGVKCELPFVDWPVLFTSVLLIGQCVYLGAMMSGSAPTFAWPWVTVNALGGVLFLQAMHVKKQLVLLHLLVGSSAVGMVGYGMGTTWSVTPDVAAAVLGLTWVGIAGVVSLPFGKRAFELIRMPLTREERAFGEKILFGWSTIFTVIGLAMTIPVAWYSRPSFPNVTIVLAIGTLVTFLVGARWRRAESAAASAVLLPLCLASAIVVFGNQELLLAYGGLVAAGLALAYLAVIGWVQKRSAVTAAVSSEVEPYGASLVKSLTAISTLFSGMVILLTIHSAIRPGFSLPAVVALCMASVYWTLMAPRSQNEFFAYGAVLGWFGTAVYMCESVFDLPLTANAFAAFLVIGCSFLLYGVNVLVGRSDRESLQVFLKPSYYASLFFPIGLIVAIPFDQTGIAAFVLLAAGSFYLTINYQTPSRWTVYVAAALFNAAIYLWVPTAHQSTGLYQLYVIPAAVTVLIFAHLHRTDLKPPVLNGIRFAACGAILAVSTFEVFLAKDSSLLQFVSVLTLSLAGIALGIGLRIKPFVFMGVAFLVLNVLQQLGLRFHQEGGIARAIILIGVGLLVLGMMIFFNVHRERILRQYRGFLVDKRWQ